MAQETKCCSKCRLYLPLDQFSPQRRALQGVRPECRVCRSIVRAARKADLKARGLMPVRRTYVKRNTEYQWPRCRGELALDSALSAFLRAIARPGDAGNPVPIISREVRTVA